MKFYFCTIIVVVATFLFGVQEIEAAILIQGGDDFSNSIGLGSITSKVPRNETQAGVAEYLELYIYSAENTACSVEMTLKVWNGVATSTVAKFSTQESFSNEFVLVPRTEGNGFVTSTTSSSYTLDVTQCGLPLSTAGANGTNSLLPTFDFWWRVLDTDGDPTFSASNTRWLSYSVSTTTRTLSVTAYLNALDVATGTTIRLQADTPIFTQWDYLTMQATTSGFFRYAWEYVGSQASTSIEQFTFTGRLVRNNTDASCNVFDNSGTCNSVLLDYFSTTTLAGHATVVLTPTEIVSGIVENCKPFSSFWSVSLCLNYLLYPKQDQVEANLEALKEDFLSRVPVGYVTRFVVILTGTTTVALPSISYTFGSTSPLYSTFNGDPIEFDPFGALASVESPVNWRSDQTTGKTLWQIVAEPLNYLLYLTLLFMIVHDVTGIMKYSHKK